MSQDITISINPISEENNGNNQHNQTNTETNMSAHQSADTHDTHSGDEFSFRGLLDQLLPDHDGFYLGPHKIVDLPKIYIDNGFHFYWNYEQVQNSGLYTVTEHHGHKQVINNETGKEPSLNLSVTNFVVFQWIAIITLVVIFNRVFAKYKKNPNKAPKGFQNAIESVMLYVRDEMVKPNIPNKKAVDFLLPYFIGLFFFVWVMNLTGLIPGGHTATGAVGVTGGLAIISFLVINITAMRVSGVGAWFKHLLGGAPVWLAPIMVPIEIVGLLVKPFALTIRLFANMTAGHVVLFSLLGILFFFKTLFLSPAITAFSLFIYALELLVATIQAYLFTVLTAIFVGLAIGHHEEHEHHAH